MSKYNLTDLYEGMSDKEYSDAQEKERLDQHPEKATIEKIQALIAAQKPKTVKEVVKTTSWSRYKKLKDRGVSVQFVTKDELNPPENKSNTPKVKEASSEEEEKFHKKLDTLVHKTFGKREEEMNEAPTDKIVIKVSELGKYDSYRDLFNRAWREFVIRYTKQNNIKYNNQTEAEYLVKKALKIPSPDNKHDEDAARYLVDKGILVLKETVNEAPEGMYIDDEEWEAEMGRTPEDTEKQIEKEMNKLKEDHQSLDPEVASRIEGLLDQPLKKKFLEAGMALIQDVTDEDPFHIDDIVSHLANELNAYYDGFGKEGDRLAGLEEEEVEEADKPRPGYHADGTPKSNDEMDDDEREEFYSDLDSVDEDQALKEHFGRFLKDYQ